ncbi:MAG: hypothetical protein WBA01_12655, partial [Phormidesmis sp.]
MKLASFRLRIALLSVALAGGALVGFGLVAWRLIYVAKVNSLDTKLDSQLQKMISMRSPDQWETFTSELPRDLEIQVGAPITLLSLDEEGRTIHYSVDGAQLGTVTLNIGELLITKTKELTEKANKAALENVASAVASSSKR